MNATDDASVWNFEYDAEGRLTGKSLYTMGTAPGCTLGERSVKYDKAGRRTAQRFVSANQPAHLALDTTQTYSYDSTTHRLTQIQRGSSATEKANYEYNSDDAVIGENTTSNTQENEPPRHRDTEKCFSRRLCVSVVKAFFRGS